MCIIVSLSIHDLWPWTCYLHPETIVFVNSQIKSQPFEIVKITPCHLMLCNMASKHPRFLDLWPMTLTLESLPDQFWACIYASIVKIDRVTHYHFNLCLTFDLWLWHLESLSVVYQLLMPAFWKWENKKLFHIRLCSKITWTILVYLNIYILNDGYLNIQLQIQAMKPANFIIKYFVWKILISWMFIFSVKPISALYMGVWVLEQWQQQLILPAWNILMLL